MTFGGVPYHGIHNNVSVCQLCVQFLDMHYLSRTYSPGLLRIRLLDRGDNRGSKTCPSPVLRMSPVEEWAIVVVDLEPIDVSIPQARHRPRAIGEQRHDTCLGDDAGVARSI